MYRKHNLFLVMLVTLLLIISGTTLLFARGKKDKTATSTDWVIDQGSDQVPQVDVGKVRGNIVIAGSSTVYPLAEKLADVFREDGYTGRITVESIGSGAGFERWTKGETDISNASRPIKDSEVAAAQSIGRDPIEFLVGIDALAVVVHVQNDWVDDVDFETLAKIYSSDKWSDVNPSWPNEEIEKFSAGTDSGTFDFFVEEIFDGDAAALLSANSLQLSEDDNILSRGVQSSKYGIGYFGYAYYNESKTMLKALKIAGKLPSDENIYVDAYPLARPLLMYTAASIMREKPHIAAFLAYTLNNVQSIIKEVGYFPAEENAYNESRRHWLEAMK